MSSGGRKTGDGKSSGGYGPLARVYDRLNRDVDYKSWADFIEACFSRFAQKKPEIVLDLGCGTGRMTFELATRGYDMIGVDRSAEMLSAAVSMREKPDNPLFLMQDMREFELYGSVGAVVSCLDSVNYLTGDEDLSRCLFNVANYLDPGGIFIFDVNTPYKFEHIYADNAYILEDEGDDENTGIFCAWQNFYDKKSRLCDFYLTIFEEKPDVGYNRSDEQQTERCYTLPELQAAANAAGLEFCGVWGDFGFGEPKKNCERWYIVVRK
jgi:SAM-dependent methyltransferase